MLPTPAWTGITTGRLRWRATRHGLIGTVLVIIGATLVAPTAQSTAPASQKPLGATQSVSSNPRIENPTEEPPAWWDGPAPPPDAVPLNPADAPGSTAPSQPEGTNGCTPGWYYAGSFVSYRTSGFFWSVPGIDASRSIRYKSTGGYYGHHINSSCRLTGPYLFGRSNAYELRMCKNPFSCKTTGWIYYSSLPSSWYLWPNRYAGYDPHKGYWNLY